MNTFFTVTATMIQQLQGGCYCTARKEVRRLRDVLKLQRNAPLRLRDVAAVWDAEPSELVDTLYKKVTA